MSRGRLGPTQTRVLEALDLCNRADNPPPTAGELSGTIARQHGRSGDVSSALRRLAEDGLVERLGTSSTGGRCWQITPAGQEALNTEGTEA